MSKRPSLLLMASRVRFGPLRAVLVTFVMAWELIPYTLGCLWECHRLPSYALMTSLYFAALDGAFVESD